MNKQTEFESGKTTVKIPAITEKNELEYLEQLYNEAKLSMIKEKTQERIDQFLEANKRYFEAISAYKVGSRLKRERELGYQLSLYSQELHTL